MQSLEEKIEFHLINISLMEQELGLATGSIRLTGRGIPKKHREAVEAYVDKVIVQKEAAMSTDNKGSIPLRKLRWNDSRAADFADGIWRYRDEESGLWFRYKDHCTVLDKERSTDKLKVLKPKEIWRPQTSELMTDGIGKFFVAKNGVKVYLFEKEGSDETIHIDNVQV